MATDDSSHNTPWEAKNSSKDFPDLEKQQDEPISSGDKTTLKGKREQDPSSAEVKEKVDEEKNVPPLDNQLESGHETSIVDWEVDDPERPLNWPGAKKWRNVGIVSMIALLTPLASSMIAPAVEPMMRDFDETSPIIASFVVSIYIVGYAIGPLFLAPLSEIYGRLYLYHINNVLFVAWNVGCARAPNVAAMLVFRLLCGLAGSCCLTIGGGTITDVFVQQERGVAMSIFSAGPILGPIIGPVGAGFLAEAGGWRWIFYLLIIAGGVVTIVALLLLRETYEPVLLEKRAQKLRKETGNTSIRSRKELPYPKATIFKRALIRPTKLLLKSPIVAIMSIYVALIYSYLYLFFTTLSSVFMEQYHWRQSVTGLAFIGLGVGSMIGNFAFGAVSDRILKRLAAGGEMKPEYRLPPLLIACLLTPIGFLWYGWTVDKKVHYIVPIIGTVFVGLGQIGTFMPVLTYLIDTFPQYAASVIAANTILRSLAGAFLPLAGPPLFSALGLGWGNTLLGCLALLMAPVTLALYKYGERIRTNPKMQVEL